jgi:hypothetical protein
VLGRFNCFSEAVSVHSVKAEVQYELWSLKNRSVEMYGKKGVLKIIVFCKVVEKLTLFFLFWMAV